MAITWNEAVARIADQAINSSFDDAVVEELAECFKTVRIKTSVNPISVGGTVTPYSVLGEDNEGEPRVILQPEGGSLIPSAFVVPTVAATDMEQVDVEQHFLFVSWSIQVPAFGAATIPPSKNTWKLLDLDDVALAPTPQVIITTQLSGCTFAIGSVGRKYYLGHAQPPSSSSAATGEGHGKNLRKGPVFNGILPAGTVLESKFFIQPGRTPSEGPGNSIAYAPALHVNVLGFVVGGTKVSFIVQVTMRFMVPFVIEKVCGHSR